MASTTDYIAAQSDSGLLQRFIAAARMSGVAQAQTWVVDRYPDLLAYRPGGGDQTVVDVYAYAAASRKRALSEVPPEPGLDLAAVTDEHLRFAVQALVASENGS